MRKLVTAAVKKGMPTDTLDGVLNRADELAPDERTFKIARRLRRYKDSYRHQGRNLTPHSLEAPPGCPDDAISVEPRDEAIGEIRPEMAGRCFVWGIEAKKNIPTHYVETS
jgi:hypothetical protein